MKKTLKILCLIAVVAALLLTAAWADNPTVTVEGNVKDWTPTEVPTTFSDGNPLVVTLTPKDGYTITKVTATAASGTDPLTTGDPKEVANSNRVEVEISGYTLASGKLTLTVTTVGSLNFIDTDELEGTVKGNVLTLEVADDDEDALPLFVTVTGGDGKVLVEGTDYTYDPEKGTVTVKQEIVDDSVVTVSAEADAVKDIFVQVEHTGVILTDGSSWAQVKRDYELEFEAIGDGDLPSYVTVELVTGKDESRDVEAEYSAKKGTLTIDKETLSDLYNADDLEEKNFGKQKYYLLITIKAAAEGKVNLITKSGKTTITDAEEISLDQALEQIDTDRDTGKVIDGKTVKADSAEIELLGDCSTENKIVVAEDFDLEITSEDPCTLSSTYTNRRNSYAIVLEEDAELDLDIAGLYYAADVAIYDEEADEDEEDVTSDLYPSVMTITGEELEGTYLFAEDGYSFAEALTIAKTAAKTCDEAVTLTLQKGKYTEKSAAVTLPEDVAVTLEKGVELTLKKALNLNGQTLTVSGTLTLKEVSGKGSLALAGNDASICCDASVKDYVVTALPLNISEQSKDGVYTYTLSDMAEEKPEEKQIEQAEEIATETAAPQSGTISITCGVGGTVSPASFTLTQGQSQIVTITTNSGYSLGSLTINGKTLTSSEMSSLLIETTTGYILSWDTAEDTSIVANFVALPSFSDVTSGVWYYSDVMYAASQGLMVGYSNGSFGATETMTVAQYLTVMYRYLQAQAPSLIPTKSTTGNTWTEGADYVNTTFLSGLYQNITTTQLTRYAVADITYRVLKTVESYTGTSYGTGEVLSFSDVPMTDTYYNAVSYLSTVNILDGYLTGTVRTYAGGNTMSRAEIAKVLHRLMLAQPV